MSRPPLKTYLITDAKTGEFMGSTVASSDFDAKANAARLGGSGDLDVTQKKD